MSNNFKKKKYKLSFYQQKEMNMFFKDILGKININDVVCYADKITKEQKYYLVLDILDNKYVQGTTAQLDQNNTYVAHTVKYNDTYDTLSLFYYNTPLYFWVICDFNNIQDPFENPKVGTILKIPTLSNIKFLEG